MDTKYTTEEFLRLWRNPPAEYRGKPFWSWNGKLEKEELIRQIHIMKEMGFGGFFMHSRTGLETEYLGQEWFELINACADEAGRLGMESWLYDEDRWPSGTAGGLVTKNPKYRMKYLRCKGIDADKFSWDDGIIAAFACRLDGLNFTDCVRLERKTKVNLPQGRTILSFTVEEMACQEFYNGQTYLDTLNKEATEAFIAWTHEKYKTNCGNRLGSSIKGIFTDEPHHGMVMCTGGNKNKDSQWLVPWTYDLFDLFQKRFGYDLIDHLPELFLRKNGHKLSPVKLHYMEHLQQMFLDNWAKPLQQWCKTNKMILTGHVLHEDSLAAQSITGGSLMRYYEYMDYPGIDVLMEHNKIYWAVKQLKSAARQLGKNWLLSELYGATGWQMNFESHKTVGDWQAIFGINLRCPHLSWYTMKGQAKRDYPASILHQSAWYSEYDFVETYFSRIHLLMSQGDEDCDILVLNPIETLWAQIFPGWGKWLSSNSEEIDRYEKAYTDLFTWLTQNQYNFDYGDEDHISRFARVDRSGHEPRLWVGRAAYKAVVISGMDTIRATSLDILAEFIDAGGKVVFAGEPPAYMDAVRSSVPGELASKSLTTPFNEQAFLGTLKSILIRPVSLTIKGSDERACDVFVQSKSKGTEKIVFLLNTDHKSWKKDIVVRINTHGYIQQLDAACGTISNVAEVQTNDGVEVTMDLPPGGEKLLVVASQKDTTFPQVPQLIDRESKSLVGPFKYSLDEKNICVLDIGRYCLADSQWQPEQEILKIDRDVRRRLGLPYRSGEMLQPWYTKKFEFTTKQAHKLKIRFEFMIDTLPPTPIELAMETPQTFKVLVNDHTLDLSCDKGWWIDSCFRRFGLPEGILKKGKNEITLTTDFSESVGLEAIYLLGEFGVRVKGSKKTLTALPEKLYPSDLVGQGLPFYTGKVTYEIGELKTCKDGQRLFIELPAFEAACVLVKSGSEKRTITFKPYQADITDLVGPNEKLKLECVLTRRNTFGPLHQVPLDTPWYDPENFVRKESEFTDDYMLYKSGLLSDPKIILKECKK